MITLSSAELAQGVVKVKCCTIDPMILMHFILFVYTLKCVSFIIASY